MYSVLTQPVIPVLWQDGHEEELGIRDVFLHAHELADIRGDSPLERYALLRLLIAMAMDMCQLKYSKDRAKLMRDSRFSEEKFDDYVRECEKDGSRFDLFDAQHPFLQSVYDAALDEKAEKPVSNLFAYLPTGNNHVVMDHRMEDAFEATPAQAFRGLCATYLFSMAGAQGYPSSVNNTPPVYVVAIGENLFETLLINMLSERECGNIPFGYADVPWRAAEAVVPKKEYPSVTMLGAMTWMPRRITLKKPVDGYISRIYLQQGKNFKGNDLWKDPHVPYRKKKDGEYASVKPEMGRALWRDVGTLIADPNGMQGKQPLALACLQNVSAQDGRFIRLRAIGLVTNQAAIAQWQEDELNLPRELFDQEDCAGVLRWDVKRVEDAQYILYRSESKLLPTVLAEETKGVFLRSMHQVIFGEGMDQILRMPDAQDWYDAEEKHIAWFDAQVLDKLKEAMEQVLDASGVGVKAIMVNEEIKKEVYYTYRKLMKGGRA